MSYSKRRDLCDELSQTVRRFGQDKTDSRADESASVASDRAPRVWRMVDRLTADDVQRLVARYQHGATGLELAAEFKIGLTNVKRLLREHGARRKDEHHSA